MSALINVCGVARSGTTMLHLMLANGPEAFACGEIYAWFRPWRLSHFGTSCACGAMPCSVWEKLAPQVVEETFHQRVLDLPGVEYVVDCSKRLSWIVDANRWARDADIAVFNVLTWKEPVDLAYSWWKRLGTLETWRDRFIGYHTELLATRLALLAVCYSDLVRRPEAELQALCEATGVPYAPGREEFWNGDHHHLFGSGGVRRQLSAPTAAITAERRHPAEFRREFAPAAAGLAEDRELQALLVRLRALAAPR